MTYQPIPNQNATAVYELVGAFTFHRGLCPRHVKTAREHWPELLIGKKVLDLTEKRPDGSDRFDKTCHLCFIEQNPGEF